MKNCFLLFLCVFLSTMAFAQEPDIPGSDHTPTTSIDGLLYKLNDVALTAMVANGNSWKGELDIPERVTYEGKTYTVERIEWLAFMSCKTLTKVRIPKTVSKIVEYAGYDGCKNPFFGCTSLEKIEVDENNQWMSSLDGVLFNKDLSRLYCFPAGASQTEYAIPESVEWIGDDAFSYNRYLETVWMPDNVKYCCGGTFKNCKSLSSIRLSESLHYIGAYTFDKCESLTFLDIPSNVSGFGESVFRWSPIKTLVIRGTFPDGFRYDTFYFMDDEVVIYVQQSEIEKLKSELIKLKSFTGTVLPLENYHAGIENTVAECVGSPYAYDLHGRRLASPPAKGIYIQNGRKVVR